MCKALLDGGAPGLHFYTLNLEKAKHLLTLILLHGVSSCKCSVRCRLPAGGGWHPPGLGKDLRSLAQQRKLHVNCQLVP